MRDDRRGAEALELALSLPLLLALLSGIVDFGWYHYQAIALQDAVRQGVRAGSVEPRDGDPIGRARAVAEAAMQDMPFTATIEVTLVVDATGDEVVRIEAEAPYVGLWSLVSMPWELDAAAAMRREDQPRGAT